MKRFHILNTLFNLTGMCKRDLWGEAALLHKAKVQTVGTLPGTANVGLWEHLGACVCSATDAFPAPGTVPSSHRAPCNLGSKRKLQSEHRT